MDECSHWTRRRLMLGAVLATAWLAASAGCARTLPPEPTASALYRDLERLVTVRQAAGWEIDRLEIEQIASAALMSACQVEPAQRLALRDWVDARIQALGGPVGEAYRRRGRDMARVADLLVLTRVRLLLDRTISVAPTDCPFWVEPDPGFRGRQTSEGRWQVSLSGGGRANMVLRDDGADLEFGGASRAMFGRVLENSLGLYAGLEVGGGAGVPKDPSGNRTSLVLGVDVVAPVMLRYYWVNTFLDVEVGYLAHATEEDWRDVAHGVHVGVYVAGRAMRVRWFFPGAGFGVAYEQTFSGAGDDEPLHLLKVGFRGSLDFDL